MEYKSPIQPLSDFYPMDVTQMPVKVNSRLNYQRTTTTKQIQNLSFLYYQSKDWVLLSSKNVICCVFYIFKEQIAWSPWKTCEGSDGNLCRCRFRPCQDRQNSSCQGGYELRFENCTGLLRIFLLLLRVFFIFLFFLS